MGVAVALLESLDEDVQMTTLTDAPLELEIASVNRDAQLVHVTQMLLEVDGGLILILVIVNVLLCMCQILEWSFSIEDEQPT